MIPYDVGYPVKEINVWTNGKAIRKYTGQDKVGWAYNHSKQNGWFRAKAIIVVDDPSLVPDHVFAEQSIEEQLAFGHNIEMVLVPKEDEE